MVSAGDEWWRKVAIRSGEGDWWGKRGECTDLTKSPLMSLT